MNELPGIKIKIKTYHHNPFYQTDYLMSHFHNK